MKKWFLHRNNTLKHSEQRSDRLFSLDKPLPMCVWNHCLMALFELIGIRCMSLTFEVDGLKFRSGPFIHEPLLSIFSWSLHCILVNKAEKPKTCRVLYKMRQAFVKWTQLAAAEVLTPHNYCHSFPLFSFLSTLFCHPLGALFNPPHLILWFLISDCPSLSFCLSPTQSFISLFLPIIPSSLLLFPQTLYFYQPRDSVLLISIIQWCRTEPVTRVTASRFTARTLT